MLVDITNPRFGYYKAINVSGFIRPLQYSDYLIKIQILDDFSIFLTSQKSSRAKILLSFYPPTSAAAKR